MVGRSDARRYLEPVCLRRVIADHAQLHTIGQRPTMQMRVPWKRRLLPHVWSGLWFVRTRGAAVAVDGSETVHDVVEGALDHDGAGALHMARTRRDARVALAAYQQLGSAGGHLSLLVQLPSRIQYTHHLQVRGKQLLALLLTPPD
jgi:hypothetical protein